MNIWKITSLLSVGSLVMVLGYSQYGGLGVAAVQAGNQPNMEAALAKLREARSFLERAEHNKGGHRVKAIELTDKAIVEVDEGVRAGNL